MRILSFVSFLLVGAAYGGPATQPACLTLETKDLCHFPFNYKGVIYDKCTYVETINNKPWCATVPEVNVTREGKLLFKSQVGDCDLESNCEVEVEGDKVGPAGCGIQNGKVREEGESWKHSDGCNTCFCSGGSPACTIALCGSRIQDRRVSLRSFFECKFKKCGELCKTGVCDGDGFCVNPLESPCVQHGCGGKSCGEECLSGDIVGSCDIDGDCDFDSDRAINSCDKQVENCSEDTLRGICSCPRHNKPVCAEDVYGHWQSVVYGNLCLYQCAKKKAACKNKRGFPELVECNF